MHSNYNMTDRFQLTNINLTCNIFQMKIPPNYNKFSHNEIQAKINIINVFVSV